MNRVGLFVHWAGEVHACACLLGVVQAGNSFCANRMG